VQLLRDLIHTTDSHRALKTRAAKQAQEVESWRDKARAHARSARRACAKP
jgi:uncharacterized membrane protein YqiK